MRQTSTGCWSRSCSPTTYKSSHGKQRTILAHRQALINNVSTEMVSARVTLENARSTTNISGSMQLYYDGFPRMARRSTVCLGETLIRSNIACEIHDVTMDTKDTFCHSDGQCSTRPPHLFHNKTLTRTYGPGRSKRTWPFNVNELHLAVPDRLRVPAVSLQTLVMADSVTEATI